jgi:hypothetical protein
MRHLVLILACVAQLSFAQIGSRAFIKQQIISWGECKNVALTLTGGDVAIYGSNGYAADGVPTAMANALSALNNTNDLIDDLVLTESGSWFILFGSNGYKSFGAPSSLIQKLNTWNSQGEVINSVTFNDNGEWIAITETKYSASDNSILEYLRGGEAEFGELWAAHMTNDGLVVCYERGFRFLGNVPSNLKEKLGSTSINVYRVKFLSDGTYFIADFSGAFEYFM